MWEPKKNKEWQAKGNWIIIADMTYGIEEIIVFSCQAKSESEARDKFFKEWDEDSEINFIIKSESNMDLKDISGIAGFLAP